VFVEQKLVVLLFTYFLRMGGMGAGAFFSPNDLIEILASPSSFFLPAVSTLLNLVFSSALPRVALTAL
jgi:hypothetical protein